MDRAFNERLEKLNSKQREAVETIDGPLLVIAGPGSGKTELLSLRIANILKETQTDPSSILCLTFTDSGAANMRERLMSIIGARAHEVAIYTFHSFARRVMDEHREYFHDAFEFEAATDVDRERILDDIFANLPHEDRMSSYHKAFTWAYMKDVKERISLIKRAGHNADTYKQLINIDNSELLYIQNIINEYWPQSRLSVKDLEWLPTLMREIKKDDEPNLYKNIYISELGKAYDESIELGKTEPIGKWKEKNLLTDNGVLILKEIEIQDKIKTVAHIYSEYERQMKEAGLYDFDDMIIDVVAAINSHEDIHATLAERYAYIMIDEFQDTSDAQMSIVLAIANHEVNEGRANVCAVGDDDQAIYKFQGAEINNIINFRSGYFTDVKVITLDTNYRSTQDIIDLGDSIASQSGERLSHKFNDINKKLKQGNTNLTDKLIQTLSFESREDEYYTIAGQIQTLINTTGELITNNKKEKFAILSKNNDSLMMMSNILNHLQIKHEYIRKQNVLQIGAIRNILDLALYISSIISEGNNKDYLLPAIILAPYWKLQSNTIFELSYKVKKENITWLEAIKSNSQTEPIYKAISTLMLKVNDTPILEMLYEIEMTLGIREYYFTDNTERYVYLEAVRSLYEAIREADTDGVWMLAHIEDFISIYDKFKLPIMIESSRQSDAQIELLTVHRAKGLEFDHVYILDLDDKVWLKTKKANKAPVPKYLKQILSPIAEDDADVLRLLFVAITRARHHLYLCHVGERLRYVTGAAIDEKVEMKVIPSHNLNAHNSNALELSIAKAKYQIDEESILRDLLGEYQMSTTHFNNYLKIDEGGPEHFLKENLLRLPRPMSVPSVYGTAIHSAVEIITQYRSTTKDKKETPDVSLNKAILAFEKSLKQSRLNKTEEKKQIDRGVKVIQNFYQKTESERDSQLIDGSKIETEVNLSHEHIHPFKHDDNGSELVHITGKLDYVYTYVRDGKQMIDVLDWKTGKTLKSWDRDLEGADKLKAHRYKYQLMMYRLLIESSHRYRDYHVGRLGLQFVEDTDIYTLYYDMDSEGSEREYERFKSLVAVVYKRIMNLEFTPTTEHMPTSDYDQISLKEQIEWEDGLMAV